MQQPSILAATPNAKTLPAEGVVSAGTVEPQGLLFDHQIELDDEDPD